MWRCTVGSERDRWGRREEKELLHLCLFPFTSFVCAASSTHSFKSFSVKVLMELLLLLALMPALLFAGHNSTDANSTLVYNATSETSPIGIRITNAPNIIRLPPILTRVNVNWEKSSPCQGTIYLKVNFTNKPQALCYETVMNHNLERLFIDICEERRCGRFVTFTIVTKGKGYMITNDDLTEITCTNVHINCEESKELVAFKAITAVLLVLVLAAILLHFARPMYTAIRKRFSQKRENRWIGPTQSQSVSYHRGQGAHSDYNMVKRQSYPGLERLTVNPSREPSSNRNSDYDSYGYH